ncbi:MAG: fimbrillin family protein [Paludibacteraceae bacterium]|nr:fimbrillin family protein [Paludibacteraceae bacterium]
MKKLFLFISVFALLVACKREEPNQPEAQYISFSQMSIENLMTAGFDNTITTANLVDFDVWGHNGAGVVFGGTKVEKQGDLWVCAEEKLWEPDQTYHFHAFAPSGAVDNVGEYPNAERERGLGNFAYTNAGDKDLIYAYATRTQGSLLKINADPVQLAFEHLLSRVEFTFKNNLSEGNITISNVQITEAVKSAELNCGDVDMANWVWNATSTGSYSFGGTTVIAKGASASAADVQFLFPAATRNYDISFSIAYESDAAEERTATISDVNLVMGKSYNINLVVNDKDVVTEEYKIEFFVTEVKDWGENIELDATINEKAENPETPGVLSGMENGHEWVDLGLSSGLKWATCNVGATTPEEYGDYFAWGEVEIKEAYGWGTYKFGTENNYTKYNSNDNKTVLDPEDDAAHVNWGGAWRMPTDVELGELFDNCIWDWIVCANNTEGYQATSKINGRSIFFPATGQYLGGEVINSGVAGYYWTSTLNLYNYAFRLVMQDNPFISWSSDERKKGFSVRPVCP